MLFWGLAAPRVECKNDAKKWLEKWRENLAAWGGPARFSPLTPPLPFFLPRRHCRPRWANAVGVIPKGQLFVGKGFLLGAAESSFSLKSRIYRVISGLAHPQ